MVQNIYALTPLQEGMLFHSLNREEALTPYFEEMDFNINGEFDIELFTQSWNKIIERHDVFRTIFIHKNTTSPKQVVLKKWKIDLSFEDITLNEETDEYIEKFIIENRQLYFDLSKKPPVRVKVFKLTNNSYRIIFAFHHIIMDGWSGGIVFSELFNIYNSLKNNIDTNLTPVKPYNQYIKWLQKQDPVKSRNFWETYLKKYDKRADLVELSTESEYKFLQKTFIIDKEQTNKINQFVQNNKLTLNTLIQTIWGLVVAKISKKSDIVFGATVSGRTDEIIGIEKMVGLFINAIPVRVRFTKEETLLDIAKNMMEASLEAKSHHYYSLADIQSLTPLKDKLIEQLLVFENYPASKDTTIDIGFEIEGLEVFNQTNYSFDITIIPTETISVMFKYNGILYNEVLMDNIEKTFLEFINLYIQAPQTKIETIIEISQKNLFVTSSFTADLIEDGFNFWSKKFDMDYKLSFSSYNQVIQDLLDITSPLYRKNGLNLILVRFEDILRFLTSNTQDSEIETIEKNFEKIVSIIKNSNFIIPTFIAVFKPIDNHLSKKLNLLYEEFILSLKDKNNIFMIDFRELDKLYQVEKTFDAHTNKTGHIPFTDDYLWAMGSFISRQVYALHHPHFKVIALDCDNTLWKGIVGEDGALGVDISCGYLELQKFVLTKEKEGFLIVLNSKNNESDAWEVFDENTNMLLTREHIVHSKINWQPKSQNLKEMAKELNLGLNSFVFLDDNPLECAEVIKNAPEVLSLPLPKNPNTFKTFLGHIWALDKIKITKEDETRTKMYQAETQRNQDSEKLSLDDFLASLELKIYMNKMLPSQLARTSQLTQRTNQFNVSTIRRDESDIENIINDDHSVCWTVNVEDKFGSYGLVAVVISTKKAQVLYLDTFLMSCRVLGRGVEKSILAGLKQYAKVFDLNEIEMSFYPTQKNKPALNFIEENAFEIKEIFKTHTVYGLIIENLPDVASFVSFHFNEGITTLKNDEGINTQVLIPIVETENGRNHFNDFNFNFLNTMLDEEIRKLQHRKFYEPIIYHKASDRVQLLEQNSMTKNIRHEFVPAKNKSQQQLVNIYQELLNIKSIGIKDNFFELGGHSLLATRVLSRVYQTFEISLTLRDIFDNPTIETLDKLLNNTNEEIQTNIIKAPIMERYPLSMMQKRVWLIDQMGGGTAYNMPLALEVKGNFNSEKFISSINEIVKRHEILRSKIVLVDAEPQQEVEKELTLNILVEQKKTKKILKEIEQDASIAFDLSALPLLRVKIYKLTKNRHVIYFNMNHIISDGWSMGIITKEISSLYNNEPLPQLGLQYKDFSYWQQELFLSNKLVDEKDYWINKLKGTIEPLNFPTDYSRFKEQSFNGETLTLDLSKELETINKFSKKQQTTLFMFLVTSIKIILARYTMQNDIVLGYPVSGRNRIELENQIGFYANTLILRNHIDFNSDFIELLHQIKTSLLEAYTHQDYPFEKILEELNVSRDLSRSPLFDYAISLNSDDEEMLRFGKSRIKPFNFDFNMAQFDMSFNFVSLSSNLYLNLNYNSDLFKRKTIKRFLKHIHNLMINLLEEPAVEIKNINFLSKKEMKSNFSSSPITETSIIERFKEQVSKTPYNKALIYDNTMINYQRLDEISSNLAERLVTELKIKSSDRVAFSLEKRFSPIAILAILKVGATFIPINRELPQNKIDYIVQDSQAKALLEEEDILISIKSQKIISFKENTDLNTSSYVIYTSGTTGNPKGVEVSQKSLSNLLNWYIDDFNINERSKVLLMIPPSFDASIKNILAPLIVGGEVIISTDKFDPYSIVEDIQLHAVNLINCVPSAFSAVLDALNNDYNKVNSLKYLAFGGEALDLSLFRDFYFNNNIKIFNIYGPTEATDISTLYQVKKDDFTKKSIPIGKAITNSRVYIVDKFNNIVPQGVIGEIIIAGEGVANGYVNNKELTDEKFKKSLEFGRYYKTGDLAKYGKSGNLKFLGREDDQVKIRGNRIELKEIESQLMEKNEIESAIVLVHNNIIIAYIKVYEEIDLNEIRNYLKERLLSYMIPSDFILIENIPLTSNGKIDKKSLLSIQKNIILEDMDNNLSTVQKEILSIFENLLNKKVFLGDNFFEIGGESLNAVKVISQINREFKKNLKLSYIFEYQIIEEFILHLDVKTLSKPYKIFNSDKEKAIFIFPALIDAMDYTLTSKKLSNYLIDYKIYALDFVLDDNRVELYQLLIESLEEDFIFLGYSSGGNLAFEVSKNMKISPRKLILLDSWRINTLQTITKKEALVEFEKEKLEVDEYIIDRYIKMLNGMLNKNKINSDIDLILFSKDDSNDMKEVDQNWTNSTNKEFSEFRGFGNHSNMLKNDYLVKNCQVINKIIKGIKNET
jgi:amino acid adenylation domain-containing protein/FkbH-like protein